MPTCSFVTVDVFTDRRFGGNQLAVFPDARGLSDAAMQSLANEFNLSETTFVLPPADPSHTARVRIFNRTTEMPFAGHPNVGTAYVLAREGIVRGDVLAFEEIAGLVEVRIERDTDGAVVGATIDAPQPLTTREHIPAEVVAACAGLEPGDVLRDAHPPLWASVGNPYVIAEVTGAALTRAAPQVAAFRSAIAERPTYAGRFSLYLYARDGERLRARMFAPLAGTFEDPATGSAATPLAALRLSLTGNQTVAYEITQGVEMGRPSLLRARAWRDGTAIRASVGGTCVPVLRGVAEV
ncbi:MAG TPA: PhzF family phenazine biosynthesis protein [Gemmatimonadaceae bacterium]|nr:PhzF family phenazine biosynthesis protein [Gemmatimonadaceae bacterium]